MVLFKLIGENTLLVQTRKGWMSELLISMHCILNTFIHIHLLLFIFYCILVFGLLFSFVSFNIILEFSLRINRRFLVLWIVFSLNIYRALSFALSSPSFALLICLIRMCMDSLFFVPLQRSGKVLGMILILLVPFPVQKWICLFGLPDWVQPLHRSFPRFSIE